MRISILWEAMGTAWPLLAHRLNCFWTFIAFEGQCKMEQPQQFEGSTGGLSLTQEGTESEEYGSNLHAVPVQGKLTCVQSIWTMKKNLALCL